MRRVAALVAALTLAAVTFGSSTAAARPARCGKPSQPMRFAEPTYVDTERAGGEPSVATHPDGTLLYQAHASTTLFYTPEIADEDTAAFYQHYTGQTYAYYSEDGGKSWTFVPRTDIPQNLPLSGFSDPDFAIDTAGQVYISEINLANVAVSKSTDSGRSYELQNFFAQTITDRQWKAADEKDVVYIVGNAFAGGTFPTDPVGNVGHHLYKSEDGGQTWTPGVSDPGGLGDIKVDQRNGTLYEANYVGDTLAMAAFRNIRDDDFTRELNTIAEEVSMLSHWPSIDVDDRGFVYITWDEDGQGGRPAGVWYSYSRDAGTTWADPVRVDNGPQTDIWPWLAVGDPGRVAVSWLQADVALPGHDAETEGDHGWRVMAAQTLRGVGCPASPVPSFRVSVATPEPVHRGTICNSGTVCQAQLIDRRMGDYFTIDVDSRGFMFAGYSDTRQGGSVALPGFVQQTGGPRFFRKPPKIERGR